MPDSNSQVAKRVEHTPGPWEVDVEETCTNVWSADKHCVAECGPRRDYANGMGLCQANARLIAAAPTMLRALEAVRNDCVEVLEGREPLSMKLIHAIVNGLPRSAIAKARGQ
jgi:hypothetical protein